MLHLMTGLPEWLKAILHHHYSPREMIVIAIAGFVIGIGYGLWVKQRLSRQKGQGKEKSNHH